MIVEDEPTILLTTAAWLEDAGFKVVTASDGLHAVDLLEQHPGHFPALVTDFHMPFGMTGAHVATHMRLKHPAVPMIITTAVTCVVTEGWRLQHGVDMLAKPYDPEALVAMLDGQLHDLATPQSPTTPAASAHPSQAGPHPIPRGLAQRSAGRVQPPRRLRPWLRSVGLPIPWGHTRYTLVL